MIAQTMIPQRWIVPMLPSQEKREQNPSEISLAHPSIWVIILRHVLCLGHVLGLMQPNKMCVCLKWMPGFLPGGIGRTGITAPIWWCPWGCFMSWDSEWDPCSDQWWGRRTNTGLLLPQQWAWHGFVVWVWNPRCLCMGRAWAIVWVWIHHGYHGVDMCAMRSERPLSLDKLLALVQSGTSWALTATNSQVMNSYMFSGVFCSHWLLTGQLDKW